MLNIRFKGKYEGEKQLIENSKLYKNATMFEEEETIKEAFKSGIKFVTLIKSQQQSEILVMVQRL